MGPLLYCAAIRPWGYAITSATAANSLMSLADRWQTVRERLSAAQQRFGRVPGSVSLLAVTKSQPVASIRELAALGQRAFGENYLREAVPKLDACADLDLEWHYIGAVQGNKTADVARRFDWVHTVASERVARRLALARPVGRSPLNVCLQVNIDAAPSKAGVAPFEALSLARAVADLPQLCLRGLMTMPAPATDFAAQRRPLRALHELLLTLRGQGLALDTLSMGMSDDLEAAVAEGATVVRIGTALFGPRPARVAY